MPDILGSNYAIDGVQVTAPDEENWSNIVLGENLTAHETRSPYQMLQWRKSVAERCDLDWWDYEGADLTSLTCTPPDNVGVYRVFTRSQKLISVVMRHSRGVAREVVATFLVDTR